MKHSIRFLTLLLFSLAFIAACGQKGPLFLPGNPSQIRTTLPQEQSTEESSEDEDVEAEEIEQ